MWLFGVGVAFAFLGLGARRVRDGPARRPCPGFPRKRERRWGWGGRRGLVVSEGGSRSCGTGGSRTAPTTGCWGCGGSGGGGGGSRLRGNDGGVRVGDGGRGRRPRPAPLPWVPAFAGTTRAGGPSTGSGRTESRGGRGGVSGEGGVTWGGCGCGTYVLFWMLFSLGLASGGVGFGSLDGGFARGTHARCVGLWV